MIVNTCNIIVMMLKIIIIKEGILITLARNKRVRRLNNIIVLILPTIVDLGLRSLKNAYILIILIISSRTIIIVVK